MSALVLRDAEPADLPVVHRIYAHYVRTSVVTFDIEPPSLAQLEKRYAGIAERGMPYLVAEVSDAVVGYAYCAPYRDRPGYRYSVEDSIYLDPEHLGRGIGGRLLTEVVERCRQAGFRQVIGVMADPGGAASLALHRACGFVETGRLRKVGFKHGRWIDTIFTQRFL